MSTTDDLEEKVDMVLENLQLKEEVEQLEEAKKQIATLEEEVQRCQAKGFGDLKEGTLKVTVFSEQYHYTDQKLSGIPVNISNGEQKYHLTTGVWVGDKFHAGHCKTQQPIPPGDYLVTIKYNNHEYKEQITINGESSIRINLDSKPRKKFSLPQVLGFLAGLAAGGIVGYNTSRQLTLASMDYKPGYVGVLLSNEYGQQNSALSGLEVEIFDGRNSYHLTTYTYCGSGRIWTYKNMVYGYAETQTEIPGGNYLIAVRRGNNWSKRNITVNKNTYVELQVDPPLPISLP